LVNLATWPLRRDIFNQYAESFPQEERRITNEYSINLRARYVYRNRSRNSWVNLTEIFRGTLVMGSPGSAKTSAVFRPMIQQSLAHGMCLFVYDLKYDDLTRLTYNTLQREKHRFAITPAFFSINFDDFSRSHRCNPLDPASLTDISDAAEVARTIILALNKRMIHLQGEFFVESAIGFFTANIWFLRSYENGKYCTLAHLLELMQTDFYILFSIIRSVPGADTLIQPFVSALANNSGEQLQGQVDSARIALSSLVSPNLYYLLSANDFTLDLNNPKAPKIICLGSNPQKQFVYSAVISLYFSRMIKLVNRKGGHPCHILIDEAPSFTAMGLHTAIAQARQNRVAITFGIQDLSQLRMEYGRDHADALINLPGNLICGQVSGDSARLVSERFGRILQDKASVSTSTRDSSTSQSQQLDLALPASKISTLSSGEFVGITADSPQQPLPLKAFHARLLVDFDAIRREESTWTSTPIVRKVTDEVVDLNFRQVKAQVRSMVDTQIARMRANPDLARLIVQRRENPNQRRPPP
jgi:Type IV secretory system Conjugative DNA transfer